MESSVQEETGSEQGSGLYSALGKGTGTHARARSYTKGPNTGGQHLLREEMMFTLRSGERVGSG